MEETNRKHAEAKKVRDNLTNKRKYVRFSIIESVMIVGCRLNDDHKCRQHMCTSN